MHQTFLIGVFMGVNPGGDGGDIPPWFWEGGDGQCFHPPLEMNEALAHLMYQHGKVQLQLFFDGLSVDFHHSTC